jgi:RNA-directed DNA polymerase
MNAIKLACAPENINLHTLWSQIDWNKAEHFVKKLQARNCKGSKGK